MERYNISDLIKIGIRRFFYMFIPAVVLLCGGLLALSQIPQRYHSKALLMVEDQQISTELVPSAIRAVAEDRLQNIRAELRARDNVIDLAEKYDLIDRTSKEPFSKRVASVRDDIRININSIGGGRRRSSDAGTVTFEIGFVHENPRTAHRVANQLVTDFLATNVEARISAVEGTAAFLRSEEEDLRRRLNDVREEMTRIRSQNPGITPDNSGLNASIVERLRQEIASLDQRIEAAGQELSLLRMQQPLIINASEQSDAEQVELREKRRQLAALTRRYTDTYPDVIALTEELLMLESRLDLASFKRRSADLEAELDAQLADTEGLTEEQIEALRERKSRLDDIVLEAQDTVEKQSLAEIRYRTSEAAINQRIANYEQRQEEAREELVKAEEQLRKMPAIAAQLGSLLSEQDRLMSQLSTTQRNRATAERSENLETQQRAERVITLESPVVPDVPTSPDKPKLAILILGAAGGVGAVLGFGPVFLFPRIETRRQLSQILPGVPVVEVPEIVDEEEQKFRRTVFMVLVGVSALLTAAAAFLAYKVLL
jgi:uncharacterized protein involved in exopolysaccharide biosynthesis